MKRIKQLTIAGVMIASAFFSSCQKESPIDQLAEPGVMPALKSNYTGCSSSCINLSVTPVVYFEKTDSKTITWGNGTHSKTVDIIYYNTETDFILKVRSTTGWADLVINGVSSWTGGPVAANTWAEYPVTLPEDWQGCDDYNVALQVAGQGPAVNFDVTYQLVGVCQPNIVYDYDSNLYHTIVIGDQTWMVENLKVTHLNDGQPIPNVKDNNLWNEYSVRTGSPAYCWYNNDIQYKEPYGAIYNWHAVNSGKLCPPGWHVASHDEWITLCMKVQEIFGTNAFGGLLKEAGTEHWIEPNWMATNQSGFTALPSGYRGFWNGQGFHCLGEQAYFWTSSKLDPIEYPNHTDFCSWVMDFRYNSEWGWDAGLNHEDGDGSSGGGGAAVRCIKDS